MIDVIVRADGEIDRDRIEDMEFYWEIQDTSPVYEQFWRDLLNDSAKPDKSRMWRTLQLNDGRIIMARYVETPEEKKARLIMENDRISNNGKGAWESTGSGVHFIDQLLAKLGSTD